MAGILGGNVACGHVQMICPSCLHVGCEGYHCEQSVAIPGSRHTCARCGDNQCIPMSDYIYKKQNEAQKQKYAEEDRIEEMDKMKNDMQDAINSSREQPRTTLGQGDRLVGNLIRAILYMIHPKRWVIYLVAWIIRYADILNDPRKSGFLEALFTHLINALASVGEFAFTFALSIVKGMFGI